ncbi:MAG: hypothetical protein ACI8ZZ_002303, partial [Gammaproteobacteria bacterium]
PFPKHMTYKTILKWRLLGSIKCLEIDINVNFIAG